MKDVELETEKKLIRQAILAEVEAEKNRDVEGHMKFIHGDFIGIGPNIPIIRGKEPYREAVVEFLKTFVSIDKFDIIDVGLSESCDLGYAVGTVQWTYEGPAGRVTESAKWHRTMKKLDDEWKCVVLSWNSDTPLE